jgi:hypothetical protein
MLFIISHGSTDEARLLLELCHRLCKRIGLDKVIREKLSLIKKRAGPPCSCGAEMGVHPTRTWVLGMRSPLDDAYFTLQMMTAGDEVLEY